ncbi:MAG: phosphoribosyltransferase family protein [Flavobacteriales bacterium]|nr:phosphoribosyltransferase family protein [Flavobacteriales bacterium]
MKTEKTLILDALQCKQKIDRMAHEINENFFNVKTLYIVGIAKRGFAVAELINKALHEIVEFETKLIQIELDKENPQLSEATLSLPLENLNNQSVVLIDDVLNSGKTLVYALAHLLQADLKLIRTITMVDRRHRRYPIKADFVGITLSTTIQEHISVEFNGSEIEVYLE